MREKDIENTLIRQIRKSGGLCLKFVSPGWSGVPDRLCLWPGGRIMFVELKKPGKKPRPLQEKRLRQLREMGFDVGVVSSKEEAVALKSKHGENEPAKNEPAKFGGGADA